MYSTWISWISSTHEIPVRTELEHVVIICTICFGNLFVVIANIHSFMYKSTKHTKHDRKEQASVLFDYVLCCALSVESVYCFASATNRCWTIDCLAGAVYLGFVGFEYLSRHVFVSLAYAWHLIPHPNSTRAPNMCNMCSRNESKVCSVVQGGAAEAGKRMRGRTFVRDAHTSQSRQTVL